MPTHPPTPPSLSPLQLALGRQSRQTFIRKERTDGSADFRQRFVFACPVPLRDRHVALELYRTSSTSRKGRLVASTQVRIWGGAAGSLHCGWWLMAEQLRLGCS